jgi:hypothetical protein
MKRLGLATSIVALDAKKLLFSNRSICLSGGAFLEKARRNPKKPSSVCYLNRWPNESNVLLHVYFFKTEWTRFCHLAQEQIKNHIRGAVISANFWLRHSYLVRWARATTKRLHRLSRCKSTRWEAWFFSVGPIPGFFMRADIECHSDNFWRHTLQHQGSMKDSPLVRATQLAQLRIRLNALVIILQNITCLERNSDSPKKRKKRSIPDNERFGLILTHRPEANPPKWDAVKSVSNRNQSRFASESQPFGTAVVRVPGRGRIPDEQKKSVTKSTTVRMHWQSWVTVMKVALLLSQSHCRHSITWDFDLSKQNL